MIQLKYLFTAYFTDGTIIQQNPADKPKNPQGKNCYSDVLEAQRNGKILRHFALKGEGNTFIVNLENGLFEINGVVVLLEGDKLPATPEKFDLIWFHQVAVSQNMTFEKKTGRIVNQERLPDFREYFIGWQCTIRGKNYQQKLAVA